MLDPEAFRVSYCSAGTTCSRCGYMLTTYRDGQPFPWQKCPGCEKVYETEERGWSPQDTETLKHGAD